MSIVWEEKKEKCIKTKSIKVCLRERSYNNLQQAMVKDEL